MPSELTAHALPESLICYLPNVEATSSLGDALAEVLRPLPPPTLRGGLIELEGDLGAGKTSFCQALLRSLGVVGRIKSPSFSLLETYSLPAIVHHIDCYRFESAEEWFSSGFEESLERCWLMLVEWPEKAKPAMPTADLTIRLDLEEDARDADAPGRYCTIEAHSAWGIGVLSSLKAARP
jgi:tRNA threonylcarbamoyladenosine biosynthesis protein TsaE